MNILQQRLLLAVLLSCFSGIAGAADGAWISLEKQGGEGLYEEKCAMCHRANGMGSFILGRRFEQELVFLEDRNDLQPDFVKTVVRQGFGLMFPMSRGEVSDEQLAAIADYLAGKGNKYEESKGEESKGEGSDEI